MKETDLVRLKHILDSALYARAFIIGRKRDDLDSDRMFASALIREVAVIGEAASKVTKETRDLLPNIEWNVIIGMRNRLIHAYFDISFDILWDTAQDNLPLLINELEKIPDLT